MSMFDDAGYQWRETYFILFDTGRRPTVDALQRRLAASATRFVVRHAVEAADGCIESLSLVAPEDCSAVDLCFRSGAEVAEESESLLVELGSSIDMAGGDHAAAKIRAADGRFDVLHFERIAATAAEDASRAAQGVDPNAVLLVISALVSLTDGTAIDPQGGVVLL